MFKTTAVLKTILLYTIMLAYMACNGQQKSHSIPVTKPTTIQLGDTVKQLSQKMWYVIQAKNNVYWFGSNGDGIFRYDGKTILQFTTKHGLSNDTIRQIKEDHLGNIYFSTMQGINQFDGKKINYLKPIKSKEWKLEPNDMWFSILGKRDEHGPYRYDGKQLYNLEFPKHFLHDEMHERGINPFFSPYEVYSIYKDRKGAMWFGTSVFGACRYDGESIQWMYEHDLTIVPDGGSFGIRSIFEDKEGQFWFCNTAHLYRFDFEQSKLQGKLQYEKTDLIKESPLFDKEKSIYYSHIVEDNNGDIWLTTWAQGVFKYRPSPDKSIKPILTKYDVKKGNEIVNLVSMYKDNQGKLWLGTMDNGVYYFNGNSFVPFNP